MLTGLVGSGAALLLAFIAWILATHRHAVPGRSNLPAEVLMTAAVLGMLFAGTLGAQTGLGHWIISLPVWLISKAGHAGLVIAAGVTLLVLVRTAIHVGRSGATEQGMKLAFFLPFLLALFTTGIFHKIDMDLQAPAQLLAAWFSAQVGA